MSLASLIATGTKVWLDGVEPENIKDNRALGVTGATSNPTIVSQIIGSGHFDDRIVELATQGNDDEAIAWALDDELAKSAQQVFLPTWHETKGDDGYVSFELDPLIEDVAQALLNGFVLRRCRSPLIGWSIEPRCDSSYKVLQWGRARMSADGSPAMRCPGCVSMLQWGRARMSADGSRRAGVTRSPMCFNGAAPG
jgi:hypothetical protein